MCVLLLLLLRLLYLCTILKLLLMYMYTNTTAIVCIYVAATTEWNLRRTRPVDRITHWRRVSTLGRDLGRLLQVRGGGWRAVACLPGLSAVVYRPARTGCWDSGVSVLAYPAATPSTATTG